VADMHFLVLAFPAYHVVYLAGIALGSNTAVVPGVSGYLYQPIIMIHAAAQG